MSSDDTSRSSTASPPTSNSSTLCTIKDCPLNEAGIIHAPGLYQHNNSTQRGLDIVFANANPPPFIWQAWRRYGDLSCAIQKGETSGEDTKGLEKEREEMNGIVARFQDYHCGCVCGKH